ncbi:MAG: peptidoglycan-binding protein, partial [Alphaproteobacteria bacterium]|nr:peptidoglycan-binding protein [Alphaproteobacteria bacterium]
TSEDDIARHAQQAIARIPLGVAHANPRRGLIAKLRPVAAARIRAFAPLPKRAGHWFAGVLPGNAGIKLGGGLALAALAVALALIYGSGRFARSIAPSDDGAPIAQTQPAGAEQFAEERPLRDSKSEFTRANLRYCTFQQIRLEALGPITEGADLLVFNALVEDWNVRCTKVHYRAEDKNAVDAEAGRRRALLEVEGRALMNGWRRKIVTTVQQLPAFAALDADEGGTATGTAVAVTPEQASDAVERLPLLITHGRATAEDPERDIGLSLRTLSLTLLRADVAMRVQRRLSDLGYAIAVDGTWGSGSRAALRRFKKANGLLGNDAFDGETVVRLFSTLALAAPANQRDDETAAVETTYPPPPLADMNPLNRPDGQRIQQRLAALGYYNGRGDGAWDNAARVALRKFKAANGAGNNENWDASTEAVLFDEQAVRAADAGANEPRKATASAVAAPVPLPPKRPVPPARGTAPR